MKINCSKGAKSCFRNPFGKKFLFAIDLLIFPGQILNFEFRIFVREFDASSSLLFFFFFITQLRSKNANKCTAYFVIKSLSHHS